MTNNLKNDWNKIENEFVRSNELLKKAYEENPDSEKTLKLQAVWEGLNEQKKEFIRNNPGFHIND
jgi:hypothetical protein